MDDQLTFVLNGERETVSDVAPTMTLLQYLRQKKRLTGTKEGCAEGDCGACTVAIGELQDGALRYRPVNACIQFLPMLHGKSVVTVEGLIDADGSLHPCQQAIVDRHASQCGFCTPGFVMSLYAMTFSAAKPDTQDINDALAGNLCRCTGYGPLIEAARDACAAQRPKSDQHRIENEQKYLSALNNETTLEMSHNEQSSYVPAHSDALATLYAEHPDATIVAGATDVGLWVTKQHRKLPVTIHIDRCSDLRAVKVEKDRIWIGAAATYADAQTAITEHFPDFGELLRRLGAAQVRSAGTLCGNVANGSPIGDTPPALFALNATVLLRKGDVRRKLPVEDFFIAYGKQDREPGEFVEAVEIPLQENPEQLRCYKISKRFDQDISALCGCFNIRIEHDTVAEARIAFGGMAATPLRARNVEDVLTGSPWTQDTIDRALPAFELDYKPISDMRASAHYRSLTAKNLLQKYFLETADEPAPTRLVGHNALSLGAVAP